MKAENAATEDEELDPWDWLPGETPKAYRAFAIYRNLRTDRSLEAVAQRLHVSKTHVARWSTRFNWVERAIAYDVHVAAIASEMALEDHAAVNARHARLGKAMQDRAAASLETNPPKKMTAAEVAALGKTGVTIERDALGMATRTEVTGKDGAPLVPPRPPIICRPALPDEMPEE